MKVSLYLIGIATTIAGVASAANVWSGTNLYYAAGLSASQRASYFSALQSAGMKVLRVWLDGQTSASTKNTPITSYGDLEASSVGTYDDTVLKLLDTVMVDARKYGIKLIISMHSYNALSRPDIYGQWYGTGYFYEQTAATNGFDNRIHIMNHVHTSLGRPWKELSDYIFGFEAQNEAMIGKGHDYILAHSGWQCDRAKVIKDTLGPGPKVVHRGWTSLLMIHCSTVLTST
ncbi:hypothetical protein FRC03_008085 [Tulasnella sp. 419]|nr:hypothetical protein FRC03_008085 [Tulasnella sp. 419]